MTFLPSQINQLTTPSCVDLAQEIKFSEITVPFHSQTINTAYIKVGKGKPLLLLHGFDSCLLEFSTLIPYLSQNYEVYALDLLGFGLTERYLQLDYNPRTIKTHLACFCQSIIKQPVVLVGASMGGGTAIDLGVTYPELVEKLVLIDSIGFSGGFPLGQLLIPPLDNLAVEFWLQRKEWALNLSLILNMDDSIKDGLRVSLLGAKMPLWKEAMASFTKSGGYLDLETKIIKIKHQTLIIWGERDWELGTEDARKFKQALVNSQLVWIKESGHAPQWEKPKKVAQAICRFDSYNSI